MSPWDFWGGDFTESGKRRRDSDDDQGPPLVDSKKARRESEGRKLQGRKSEGRKPWAPELITQAHCHISYTTYRDCSCSTKPRTQRDPNCSECALHIFRHCKPERRVDNVIAGRCEQCEKRKKEEDKAERLKWEQECQPTFMGEEGFYSGDQYQWQ